MVGLLFVAPAFLFSCFITLLPLARMLWMSLYDLSLFGGSTFVGLRNYVKLWNDDRFWASLTFTLAYTVAITIILVVLGYAFALLTSENSLLRRLTRGVIFLPVVVGLGSSSLLWYWLFDPRVGLLNQILMDLRIIEEPAIWFADLQLAFWAVIASVVWKVVGFGMILFVAAIQSIPGDLHESAMVDGAGYWRRLRSVTLPLTKQTILLFAIICTVSSMLAFEQFYIMTSGGPRNATISSVYWIYLNSFSYFKLGYGAALSASLMLIIFSFSVVQVAIMRRAQ
jgi:multiple sugar transport system permease protein